MKTRERLRRIRKSKSWTEKRLLARDSLPGTTFDGQINNLLGALPYAKPESIEYTNKGFDVEGMARNTILCFGLNLVNAIKAGNSQVFFDLANAVKAWRGHKPEKDRERLALVEYCIPPHKGFSVEEILTHFKAKRIPVNENTPRKIYRLGDDLGIKIKGESGRPKTMTRTQ